MKQEIQNTERISGKKFNLLHDAGFTLIEILVVVAIIAILASVIVIGLGSARKSGRDARRVADLKQTQNALEIFYNKCRYYPGQGAAGGNCPASYSQITASYGNPSSWNQLAATLSGANIAASLSQDPAGAPQTYYYSGDATGQHFLAAAYLSDPSNPAMKSGFSGASWYGITMPPTACGGTIAATGQGVYCIVQ